MSYSYPFDEFSRDFDAILPPPNAAPQTFAQHLHVIREHIKKTYPDEIDRLERGPALGMIASFISRHITEFDTASVAVRGTTHDLISEELLRAAHTLICRYCFGDTPRHPTPTEVLELAQQFQAAEPVCENQTTDAPPVA